MVFVCTYHPAALGSNLKHTINAFFNLYLNCNEKRTKINKKWPGLAHFFKLTWIAAGVRMTVDGRDGVHLDSSGQGLSRHLLEPDPWFVLRNYPVVKFSLLLDKNGEVGAAADEQGKNVSHAHDGHTNHQLLLR